MEWSWKELSLFLCALEKLETDVAFCDLPSIFVATKSWEKEWGAVAFGFLSGKYLIFWKVLIFFNQKIKPYMFISINIDWMYARED